MYFVSGSVSATCVTSIHHESISCIGTHPQMIAVGTRNGNRIYLHNPSHNPPFYSRFLDIEMAPVGIEISADKKLITVLGNSGEIQVWDLTTHSKISSSKAFISHDGSRASSISMVSDRAMLVLSSYCHKLSLVELPSLKLLAERREAEVIGDVAKLEHQGKVRLCYVKQTSGKIALLDIEANHFRTSTKQLGKLGHRHHHLSSAGQHCLATFFDQCHRFRIKVFNSDLQEICNLRKHYGYGGNAVINPAQRWIANSLGNGVFLWDFSADVALGAFSREVDGRLQDEKLKWLDERNLLVALENHLQVWQFEETLTFPQEDLPRHIQNNVESLSSWAERLVHANPEHISLKDQCGLLLIKPEQREQCSSFCRSHSRYREDCRHIIVPSGCNGQTLFRLLTGKTSKDTADPDHWDVAESLKDIRQLLIDHTDNLTPEAWSSLINVAESCQLSLMAVATDKVAHQLAYINLLNYFQHIETYKTLVGTIDWETVARAIAPVASKRAWANECAKRILNQSARYRLQHNSLSTIEIKKTQRGCRFEVLAEDPDIYIEVGFDDGLQSYFCIVKTEAGETLLDKGSREEPIPTPQGLNEHLSPFTELSNEVLAQLASIRGRASIDY